MNAKDGSAKMRPSPSRPEWTRNNAASGWEGCARSTRSREEVAFCSPRFCRKSYQTGRRCEKPVFRARVAVCAYGALIARFPVMQQESRLTDVALGAAADSATC